MLRRLLLLPLVLCSALAMPAQPGHTQTAREALIEMFSGTSPQAFERHLLNETAQRIHQLTTDQQKQYQMSRSMMKGGAVESGLVWFGDGPVLVSYTDPKTSTKFDVMVERDEPGDGTEDMELSFRSSGTTQQTISSFVPRLLVSMKRENDVWKLAEIGFSVKVKLDAALLDSIAQKMNKSLAATTTITTQPALEIPVRTLSKQEKEAVDGLRSLLSAEQAYKIAFPGRGYTCSLGALGGQGDGVASDDRAGLIDARLESGTLPGYRVSLLGCKGEPVNGYKIMAVPEGAERYGKRAFCADETGAMRFSVDGRGITCLTEKNLLK